jgi:hypothetical protein
LVRLLNEWESRTGNAIGFVLQVGYFEPIAHHIQAVFNQADVERTRYLAGAAIQIALKSGAVVNVCCLANVERGEESVAFFRVNDDGTFCEVAV